MGKVYIRYDKIWEFEHRYVIALFIEAHPDVKLIKHIKDYYFEAEVKFENKYRRSVVCLFSTKELSYKQKKLYGVRNRKQVSYRRSLKSFSGDKRYDRKVNNLFEETYRQYLANPVQHILKSVERTSTNFSEYAKSVHANIEKNPMSALFFEYYVKFLEEKDELLFKYKQIPNDDADKEILHNFIDGEVTFIIPTKFNDPFDCDCEIPHVILKELYKLYRRDLIKDKDGKRPTYEDLIERYNEIYAKKKTVENGLNSQESAIRETFEESFERDFPEKYTLDRLNIKEKFRVLCLTPEYANILMWGYYGNSGDGVCGGFYKSNIYKGVETSRKNYILVYGDVYYTDKVEKPKYASQDILSFVIECVYTKYGIWRHEQERRFLLIEDEFEDKYVPIKASCDTYYLGEKTNVDVWKKEYDNSPRLHKLNKHATEYRLI